MNGSTRYFALLIVALLLAQAGIARAVDPAAGARAAVEQFLSLNRKGALATPQGRDLLRGEMAGSKMASWGPLPASDALVMRGATGAVARLPAGVDHPDIYLFLDRQADEGWAIDAARAMALTGIPSEIRRLLRAKASLTPEERDSLAEVELTLSTDRELAAWFGANRSSLEQLRSIAEARHGSGTGRIGSAEAREALHRLHATALEVDNKGAIVVTLGGMVDNLVGFLFAAKPGQVPAIDPSDHIWVEPMGGGWYLFRTT